MNEQSRNDGRSELSRLIRDAIDDLDSDHETSMSLWHSYWNARNLLRDIAMDRYHQVNEHYAKEGLDAWMPSEGFKEIAADINDKMRAIRGEF